jgi:outer membrane receptor protein involved in Fe transport
MYLLLFTGIFLLDKQIFSQDINERIKILEETLKIQQETILKQQKIIEQLQDELQQIKKQTEKPEILSREKRITSGGLFGAASAYNPNISLLLDSFGYTSNIKETKLESWNIPGFISEGLNYKKGMNIHTAELYIFSPVDPFFNLYATIPVKEEGIELEEAYFVTTSLPSGIQGKIGKFKSGFGRQNSQHVHTWYFVDPPLAYRAFLGEEGITEKGIQLTFLPKFPIYTQFGIEALQGENEILFGEDATSGLHAFSAFVKTSFDIGENSTILFGPSIIVGKTKTSSIEEDHIFSGDSSLCGFEFTYKWKPSRWKSFTLQSEYLWRHQKGTLQDNSSGNSQTLERTQDGFYLQAIYQKGRWGFGTRYDILEPFNDKYKLAGVQENFEAKPWKTSAMIEFNPSEFSKIRLQYNYDKSARNGKNNSEWFLQFITGIGAHAAHSF